MSGKTTLEKIGRVSKFAAKAMKTPYIICLGILTGEVIGSGNITNAKNKMVGSKSDKFRVAKLWVLITNQS